MAASSISSSMAVDLATVQPADILSRPANTCLLLCDVQHKIMDGTFKDKDRTPVLAQMRKVLDACRAAEVRTGYVVVRFRAGHPEIAPTSKVFHRVKAGGILTETDASSGIDERVAPTTTEPVFVKRRVGAFSTTDLEAFLRAKGVETIVLAGFSTSGVILSTLCWAADRDFRVVVLKDLCADGDDEVHRVLTEKVFLKQGFVMNSAEILPADTA